MQYHTQFGNACVQVGAAPDPLSDGNILSFFKGF